MTLRLLTEHQLEFLNLKRGCKGSCQNATLLEITCRGSIMFIAVHIRSASFKCVLEYNEYRDLLSQTAHKIWNMSPLGKQQKRMLACTSLHPCCKICTVKSRLSKRRLSETTGLFEDDWQSRLFSLLSIAIKLPIIQISIIRKIQFFEVIRRSRLKKLLLNYPSRFEVQKSGMVIMISLFSRVRFTHLSDLANKVATGN